MLCGWLFHQVHAAFFLEAGGWAPVLWIIRCKSCDWAKHAGTCADYDTSMYCIHINLHMHMWYLWFFPGPFLPPTKKKETNKTDSKKGTVAAGVQQFSPPHSFWHMFNNKKFLHLWCHRIRITCLLRDFILICYTLYQELVRFHFLGCFAFEIHLLDQPFRLRHSWGICFVWR